MPFVITKKNGKRFGGNFVLTTTEINRLRNDGNCYTVVNTTTRRASKIGATCRTGKRGMAGAPSWWPFGHKNKAESRSDKVWKEAVRAARGTSEERSDKAWKEAVRAARGTSEERSDRVWKEAVRAADARAALPKRHPMTRTVMYERKGNILENKLAGARRKRKRRR